jgi:hypothetical protein
MVGLFGKMNRINRATNYCISLAVVVIPTFLFAHNLQELSSENMQMSMISPSTHRWSLPYPCITQVSTQSHPVMDEIGLD